MASQAFNGNTESNSKPNILTAHNCQQREEEVKKIFMDIVHADKCVDESCPLEKCLKCKKVLEHVRQCKKQQEFQCPICKRFVRILHFHAKPCAVEFCAVPFCHEFREIIAKKNEEALIQEFGNLSVKDFI
uniref:histone acetyltransferase n=1 Tax=Panagrolaimus davidi TaxID=227884 RepID=A0A914QR13_9BILA